MSTRISNAVEILNNRYLKGNPKRRAAVDREKAKFQHPNALIESKGSDILVLTVTDIPIDGKYYTFMAEIDKTRLKK